MYYFFKPFRVLLFFFFLVLLGCTKPTYTHQKSALIVIKSNQLRFADMGFIYQGNQSTKVEIYASGQALLALRIHHNSICMDKFKCLDPQSFNKRFLASDYPKEFLSNIFNQKPIFGAQNLIQTSNGFRQRIVTQDVNIDYMVMGNELYFKDCSNNVLIKINEQ